MLFGLAEPVPAHGVGGVVLFGVPVAPPSGVAVLPCGVAVEPWGVAVDPCGVAVDPCGVAVEPRGVAAEPWGVAVDPCGVAVLGGLFGEGFAGGVLGVPVCPGLACPGVEA